MTEQEDQAPRTIVRLEVDSFKRIVAARVTPTPTGLVEIRGKNMAGKSSMIDAIVATLRGRKGAVELPIREGAHAADVKIDLGNLIAEKTWTRDSAGKAEAKLVVTGKDGFERKGPQGVLDELTGEFADPIEFLAMRPEDQVRTVIQTLGIGEDLERLEAEASRLYDERKGLGRDADRLAKTVQELATEVDGLPAPPEGPSVDELTAEFGRRKDHNAVVDAVTTEMNVASDQGRAVVKRLEEMERAAEEVNQQIVAAKHEVEVRRGEWTAAQKKLEGLGGKKDTDELVEKVSEHEVAAAHNARRALLEEKRAESEAAQIEHASKETELEAKRAEVRSLLAGAPFPLKGMSYDQDAKSLTIGGIPIGAASQAERLAIAASVAMAGDPPLKVMFARDGSMLDDESRMLLAKMAEDRGFQFFLEMVDSNAEGAGIYIEDGEVVSGGEEA